jgi:hypothetical protein
MRPILILTTLITAFLGGITEPCLAEDNLICCAGNEVFIIPAKPGELGDAERIWSWTPQDSPEIDAEQAKWFRSCDECKPVGDTAILITSSSGGVALIDRSSKKCRFLAYAKNAHSACLLPGNRIAVAASTGGDEILVFQIDPKQVHQPDPIARSPLVGGHGAEWDAGRERLWALGEHELQLLELSGPNKIVVEKSWPLPTHGGHDLSPTKDGKFFYVTSNSNVYLFEKATGKFTVEPVLGEFPKVKSVDQHPESGRVVFHRGTPENWWSETIRFRGSDEVIKIPGKKLYKARWDRSGR